MGCEPPSARLKVVLQGEAPEMVKGNSVPPPPGADLLIEMLPLRAFSTFVKVHDAVPPVACVIVTLGVGKFDTAVVPPVVEQVIMLSVQPAGTVSVTVYVPAVVQAMVLELPLLSGKVVLHGAAPVLVKLKLVVAASGPVATFAIVISPAAALT